MSDEAAWHAPVAAPEVRRFLEGPRPRGSDLVRAVAIFLEFMRGFRTLHFVGPCVTVFGSARFKEDHPYYALAREIGAGLAPLGFTVPRQEVRPASDARRHARSMGRHVGAAWRAD